MPVETWAEEDGKVALALGERQLTPEEVRTRYPALGMAVGGERPMRQGLIREYVPVEGTQGEDHR